jgi:hypothetical protein
MVNAHNDEATTTHVYRNLQDIRWRRTCKLAEEYRVFVRKLVRTADGDN